MEKYEQENNPFDPPKPLAILQHLMEAKNIIESDLVPILGDKEIVKAIMEGQSLINENQAEILANYFQVSPHLFFNNYYK